jgi:hypothetical protein
MKSGKVLVGLLLAGFLGAQTLQIEGPVSGFIFDESQRALRPIVGLPGAAYFGDAVVSELAWASVAPDGQRALVLKDGALFSVSGLKGPEPTWVPVAGVRIAPERAAWAEDGSVALIYNSASGTVQRVRGFNDLPLADDPIPLGDASALAVDRNGRIVAGTSDGVFLVDPSGLRPLLPGLRAISLAVAGTNLLVAAGNGEIWRIRDYAGEASAELLAAVEDPVGVALSQDQKYLLVAGRAERAVLIYELAARAVAARLVADAEPTTLARLGDADLWLVRTSSGPSDPLLVLKISPEPAIWFVPAGKGE